MITKYQRLWIGNPQRQKVNCWLPGTQGMSEWGMTAHGCGFYGVGGDDYENALELGNGSDWKTLWVLSNSWIVQFKWWTLCFMNYVSKKDKAALGKGKKVIGDAILYSVVRMPQRSGASFIWRSEGIEGVKYGNV